ncbi:hypothetical protein GGTG_07460 [Gaeumannomyces tritici R3-111a-1]|uniref:Heterokaryon incompatibility domain-containing protein n=1 Tax=Gaeumannomyces tritici (strain R3-111a-1) TaxID=644352 RepID=J3P1R2_GAET3|nr:hypothetical protein GGTG_07460 [Gaeumannomyces tritici R3-111a-1]EJT73604.1 hypothetical protein GGTG_07460 [Gaeumannomyces tritici R3-111a-1]
MATYTYEPIDLSKKAIRLLRLFRAVDPEDDIKCEIFQSLLDEDQALNVEYEALSYTWSDAIDEGPRPGKAPGPKRILIQVINDLCTLHVTENLYMALKHLRLPDSDRILWIDAICINQDEHENEKGEKNHQVGQMNIVYSSAQNVIIWLGPGSSAITELFCASAKLHEHAAQQCLLMGQTRLEMWKAVWRSLRPLSEGNAPLLKEHHYDALMTVLRRPWFGRVWVIQEVALAKKATIMCGRASTPTSSFALMPSLLGVEAPKQARALLDVMPSPVRKEERSWWKEKRDLFTVLRKFGNCSSTKPHDRIYALLGISADPHAIKPRYEATEQQVVEDVLKLIIFEHGDLPEGVNLPQWSVNELMTKICSTEHMGGENIEQILLSWAVRKHEMGLAGYLLERQPQFPIPVGTDRARQPTLHLLAETPDSQDLVKDFARRHGMELDFNRRFGSPEVTALQRALNNGNTKVADALSKAQESALEQFKTHFIQGYGDLDPASAARSTEPLLISGQDSDLALRRLLRDDMAYLEMKARYGQTLDLRLILDHVPAVSPPSPTALRLAIESGSKSAIELLIQRGADVNKPSGLGTPLEVAILWADNALVELLLDYKADPSHGFPLHWAVQHGRLTIASRLMAAGADIDAVRDCLTPLEVAIAAKNTQMAALLLVYQDNNNPAMLTDGATEKGTSDGKDASVSANANRDLPHHHDSEVLGKALGKAIVGADDQAVLLLLRHEADPSIGRWSADGPNLWLAASQGYTSVAMSILSRPPPGFDVNERCRPNGTTALHRAAYRGDEDLVRALLEYGADMEIRDNGGATALWAASANGRLKCVHALLEAGADTEVHTQRLSDPGPMTPLAMAKRGGFAKVATLISRHIQARKKKQTLQEDSPSWWATSWTADKQTHQKIKTAPYLAFGVTANTPNRQ